MKPDLIVAILRRRLSVVADEEQSPIIVGIEYAALEIVEAIDKFKEADLLIKLSNLSEPKY